MAATGRALLQDLEADCFANSEQRVLAAYVVRRAAAAATVGCVCEAVPSQACAWMPTPLPPPLQVTKCEPAPVGSRMRRALPKVVRVAAAAVAAVSVAPPCRFLLLLLLLPLLLRPAAACCCCPPRPTSTPLPSCSPQASRGCSA